MDGNNRVRGNALYGLYLLRAEGVRQQILAMSRHPDATFRSTAAWVMGETMDPEFLIQLQEMVRTERGAARMSALRALARLRSERQSHTGAQHGCSTDSGSVGPRIEDRAID
jgi:hypothetical protein